MTVNDQKLRVSITPDDRVQIEFVDILTMTISREQLDVLVETLQLAQVTHYSRDAVNDGGNN